MISILRIKPCRINIFDELQNQRFRIHHQRKKTRNSLLYNIYLKEFIAEERRLHSPDHLNSVYSQPGYGHENR